MKTIQRTFAYGDRIYARLVLNGRKVTEFIVERVSDMTELIGELRHRTRRFSGLAQLYVRNMSRGWSIERPFMLYADSYPGSGRTTSARRAIGRVREPQARRMAFPWETH